MLSPREITPSGDPSKDKQKTSSLRSSTRVTRSTTSPPATDTSIGLSKTEIIKNSQSSIKNTESAKKWLHEREYILKGEELSIPLLTAALLSLANGPTNSISQLVNGIRAIAICLDSALPETTNLEAIRDTIETATSEITTEATSILSNLAENAIKSISEIEAKCQDLVLKAQEHVNSEESATIPPHGLPLHAGPTYADMLKKDGPPGLPDDNRLRALLAKEGMMKKQILIDGIEGIQNDSTELTPKLIVAKANLAIELMEDPDSESHSAKPQEAKIVSAKILSNKGVILEALNEETAAWLRHRAVDFVKGMGSQASLKDRSIHLVLEFVPTTINDQLPNLLQAIESENQLSRGTIRSVRWMRAPANWRPDQKSAHVILTTNDTPSANSILKNGLIIEGSRLQARKLEEEPKRCFKCQKFTSKHTAANCQEITCWCPNCAGPHSTEECQVTDRNKLSCIGCIGSGSPHNHAAWDKRCPAYIKEKSKILDRHPEYDFRFYITNEPWTWERKQDVNEDTQKWRGNTHENRRQDPAWKGNTTTRSDNGWRGRLGPGALRDAPTKTGPRRREPPRPSASTPAEASTSTSTQTPPLPTQSVETIRRRPNSRPRTQTGSRSRSERRPDGQQLGPSQGSTRQTQSTIDGWIQDYEADRIRESQKIWGSSQTPSTEHS
jgi:hypothetical protein